MILRNWKPLLAYLPVETVIRVIHPNPAQRAEGFRRLELLASHCNSLGVEIITLCTGTCDAEYMWRGHPDNSGPRAFSAALEGLARAARIAERHGVVMAFEPEVSSVIDSARKARAALDAVASDHLKVCMDGANLYHCGELARMHQVLDEAFQLLGEDIVLAHAKDVSRDGDAGHEAAGTGRLDYAAYLGHLREAGYRNALVLHSLCEDQVPACRAFLLEKLRAARGQDSGGGKA